MCFVVRLISVELVEELERQGARWSPSRWKQAAMLSSVILRQALRDVVCRKPLEKSYEARTPFGSIAASTIETRDIIKLRVYHLSFTTRPFLPKRHLHRLLGRAFTRETFVLYGLRRSLDLMPGIQVPWRHVPRNENSTIKNQKISFEAIRFASTVLSDVIYSSDARTSSDNAKHWAPHGSHDSSWAGPLDDAQFSHSIVDRLRIENGAAPYSARSQSSYSQVENAYAKGNDGFAGDIPMHKVFVRDHDIFDGVEIIVPTPAKTCVLDSDALETAQVAPSPWMYSLSTPRHAASRPGGTGYLPPRPHASPRPH